MSGELRFTDEQRRAIDDRDGPLLLSANAGSGKTRVLTERLVRAVLDDGIEPQRLLAITFTEKAAGELRGRVRARFTELGARAAAREVERAWLSTIHGFCARVLRAHAPAAGLDPRFSVLDPAAARALRGQAFDAALAQLLDADGPRRDRALDLVAAYKPDRLRVAIEQVHDELRSRGSTAPVLPPWRPRGTVEAAAARLEAAVQATLAELGAVPKPGKSVVQALEDLRSCADALRAGDAHAAAALKLARRGAALQTAACDQCRDAVAALAEAAIDAEAQEPRELLDGLLRAFAAGFAERKRRASALDYDDLELGVRDLFDAAPAIAQSYAERFARIMVDEFQDTNPLQLALLQRLDRGNLFLVGDELQSIYGFRHADVEVFRGVRADHAARGQASALATNWRSHPELLSTLNAAFGAAHEHYVPLVAGRVEEDDDGGPRTELLLVDPAVDEDAALDPVALAALQDGMPAAKASKLAEARAVARRVAALVDAGEARAGDVAILLRAATELHVFERALELEGLATLASGGRGFWLREQVQDLTAYLAALANPRDAEALYGLLASPLVGVSADGLALVALTARGGRSVPWDALDAARDRMGSQDRARLARFLPRFAAERAAAPRRSLDELLARAVEQSGYDLHVLGLPGGRRRLANVHKLQRLAATFEAQHGRDVRAFLDHVTAEVEAEAREPDAPVELGGLDAVRLMTIHAAKGLEFPVVVVADLGRQKAGGLPDLLVGSDGRLGLRLARLGRKPVDALAYAELREHAQAAETGEERRILHVAMTRAEQRLVLSGVLTPGTQEESGVRWPTPSPIAPALAYVGPQIDPALPARLLATPSGRVDLDVERDGQRLRVRAELVGAGTLQLPPPRPAEPTGEPAAAPTVQLQLALDAVIAPPQPVGAPVAPTLSFSALSDYDRCAYRFYAARVLRLPPAEPPTRDPYAEAEDAAAAGLDKLQRGSLVHLLLEEGTLDPDDAQLDEAAERLDAELGPGQHDDVRDLVRAFAASDLAGRLARARRVDRERQFTLTLDDDPDGPLLVGVIDVLADEGDGRRLIVDYKTNPVLGVDLAALVDGAYGAQRALYALAALRSGAHAVEVAYAFLERPDEPVATTFTQADLPQLTAELRGRAAGALAGRYPVTDVPHRELCLTCPVRGTLCTHPEERVLRPLPASAAAPQG